MKIPHWCDCVCKGYSLLLLGVVAHYVYDLARRVEGLVHREGDGRVAGVRGRVAELLGVRVQLQVLRAAAAAKEPVHDDLPLQQNRASR